MKISRDINGNKVLKIESSDLKGAQGFSIQTLGNLPLTHSNGVSNKTIGEVNLYVYKFGTELQKLKLDLEINKNGALILERRTLAYQVMHESICNKYHCTERYYNNGYTSLHGSPLIGWLVSYCEGDICIIHCATKSIYDAEVNSHVSFFKENN